MAISRIAGPMLLQNLDRQGVPLQFTTDGQTLLYLNFSEDRIGVNTLTTTDTLTVNGSVGINLLRFSDETISSIGAADIVVNPGGRLTLPDITRITIPGGNFNYVLTTDGFGNLSWSNPAFVSTAPGNLIALGTPTDGNLVTNSAYKNWSTATSVTDAVDDLNEVMLNVYQNTYVGSVNFTSNVTQGPSSLTVQFNGSALGNPNSWFWDFGDSTTSTQQNPIKTYNNPLGGLYTVTLTARNTGGTNSGNGKGAWASKTVIDYITLYTPIPIPSFILDTNSIDSGASVSLTNTSLYATSYVIDWGDSTTTVVNNNTDPGGISGPPATHIYTNSSGDARYFVKISATSLTAGPNPITVDSATQIIKVYSTHIPNFSASPVIGNNAHTFDGNGNPIITGLEVNFTNTTATAPGSSILFGSGNYYRWQWGDTTETSVNIGTGNPGDTGQNISKSYTLSNPTVQETFFANLSVYNGHSTSPFTTVNVPITVHPAPTAQFTASLLATSDRIGDTVRTGYLFTDLNGIDRATINLSNTSYNTDTYFFDYGDSTNSGVILEGQPGSPTGSILSKTYTSTGVYTLSLQATGPNSLTPTDNTLTRTNYITILPAPLAPAGLSGRFLSFSAQSVGDTPAIAAGTTDNTGGSMLAPGTVITRITTADIQTNTVLNVYNAHSGVLSSELNGVEDGAVTFTSAVDTGVYGAVNVTEDKDANVVSPTIYPSNFYKVFSAFYFKSNASIPVGYNRVQLKHSDTGNSSFADLVKDDLTVVPTISTASANASVSLPGTYMYISGVPYFTGGGQVAISDITLSDWIGQTYRSTTSPLTFTGIVVEGTGSLLSSQTKTYLELNGTVNYLTGGIPNAGTGQLTPYTIGTQTVNINGSGALVGKVQLSAVNVNGISATATIDKNIQLFTSAQTGFVETNIPVSPTLGSFYTDNGKRINTGWSGDNPVYSASTDYYTNNAFVGNVNIVGTDEAVVRWGILAANTTDYSIYLPPGPNLTSNPTTQYIRIAFRRRTMANFFVTFTGRISGMWIAAPGTQIDNTSTLNGWLNASQVYAGVGLPGANTGAGGNGSDGCAYTAGDIVPLGSMQTNKSCRLTLGTENASNSFGNQIFINIKLAPGDSLSALSIS